MILLVKIDMCSKYRHPNASRTEGGPGGPGSDYEGWQQGHGAQESHLKIKKDTNASLSLVEIIMCSKKERCPSRVESGTLKWNHG